MIKFKNSRFDKISNLSGGVFDEVLTAIEGLETDKKLVVYKHFYDNENGIQTATFAYKNKQDNAVINYITINIKGYYRFVVEVCDIKTYTTISKTKPKSLAEFLETIKDNLN